MVKLRVENHILRQNARRQLGGNIFDKTWLMVVVVYLLASAILGVLNIASIVLAGPLTYGITRICVNLVKGKKDVEIEELFCGFKENFAESLLLSLMSGIFVFLWSLLFLVPGIIKSYSYAMAPYILQDDHTKDWKTCLEESKQMMDGNKAQLFCLDLSFIGWALLGMLCCGIGVLFVYPYMITARANFYMALKAQAEQEQIVF